MKISTTRFGDIEVNEDKVVDMPEGIPGFDECKRFLIIGDEDQPIKWFQSIDKPEVALPIISPFLLIPDYEIELSDDDVKLLEIEDPKDVLIFSVVVIPTGDPMSMTANMKAPIVINTKKRKGKQVILMDERYPIRYMVFGKQEKKASSERGM